VVWGARRRLFVSPPPRATPPPPGRRGGRPPPAALYKLTEDARRLFPQGYDALASELLEFLSDEHGREGVRRYLRWRLERQVDDLREAVSAEDLHQRLEQLAAALSEDGFDASVDADGQGFTLTQQHCAIFDVARHHPEVCAYEAATFSKVLGRDVTLSRRETLADGAPACVCCVAPRDAAGQPGRTDRGNKGRQAQNDQTSRTAGRQDDSGTTPR
jgi:predicted ArsR family transcriptional regulator